MTATAFLSEREYQPTLAALVSSYVAVNPDDILNRMASFTEAIQFFTASGLSGQELIDVMQNFISLVKAQGGS